MNEENDIISQIEKGFINALSSSDNFDKSIIEDLKKLTESGRLTDQEAIVKIFKKAQLVK